MRLLELGSCYSDGLRFGAGEAKMRTGVRVWSLITDGERRKMSFCIVESIDVSIGIKLDAAEPIGLNAVGNIYAELAPTVWG
jgi:hypothetical protein